MIITFDELSKADVHNPESTMYSLECIPFDLDDADDVVYLLRACDNRRKLKHNNYYSYYSFPSLKVKNKKIFVNEKDIPNEAGVYTIYHGENKKYTGYLHNYAKKIEADKYYLSAKAWMMMCLLNEYEDVYKLANPPYDY